MAVLPRSKRLCLFEALGLRILEEVRPDILSRTRLMLRFVNLYLITSKTLRLEGFLRGRR